MPYLFNLFYLLALTLLSPVLLYKIFTTGKYRRGLWAKLFGAVPYRKSSRPCVWFHGVSVGEVHLLRQVVARFRQACPEYDVVISTTTYTGFDEAKKHFADLHVFYWPLDFSWSIKRALKRIRPEAIILAESEIWPNFLLVARKLGVQVAIINGRLSPRSRSRYQKLGTLARWLFGKIDLWAMQSEDYAQGICQVGADAARVFVTGNVKYDGVKPDRTNDKTDSFRQLFNIGPFDLVFVAGSTQVPEEEIALGIYQRLKERFPMLRLLVVPRQKERFLEVADLMERHDIDFVRRSQLTDTVEIRDQPILVDSIGELGAIWGLADIAFVGGSLDGKRGGQNMIEPAAYGAAVLFGPHTWNFRETVARLLQMNAAIQVASAEELETQVTRLLEDNNLREQLGQAAQKFVQSQQGATDKTIYLLQSWLGKETRQKEAA